MTLPEQMTDRWARRPDPAPGQRTLYWHVLMRDYPEVGELASQARHRLAPFTGLHMTPPEWLHMTTHVAGPAGQFSDQQMQHMTAVASDYLAGVPPVTVSLGKILYHSEAIMLAVTPVGRPHPDPSSSPRRHQRRHQPGERRRVRLGATYHALLQHSRPDRPADHHRPRQATARAPDRPRHRESRHPGRSGARMELDHGRHHPPAGHRLGVARTSRAT
jgi:hypothetical protein